MSDKQWMGWGMSGVCVCESGSVTKIGCANVTDVTDDADAGWKQVKVCVWALYPFSSIMM